METDDHYQDAAELAESPPAPEGFFEGTGCVLTLREPWHKSGNRVLRVAHTAAQVRDRLRRGEFARFDRLASREYGESDSPISWSGWMIFHEIHIRTSEVVLIDEREFGVASGLSLLTGVDMACDALRDQTYPQLAALADSLHELITIGNSKIPWRRKARKQLALDILMHTTGAAIAAGQIKKAMEPHGHEDSNEAQPPREGEAGQDPAEERPDERD